MEQRQQQRAVVATAAAAGGTNGDSFSKQPRPGGVEKPRGSFYTRRVSEGQKLLEQSTAELQALQRRHAELQAKAGVLERLVMQQQGLAQHLASFVSPPPSLLYGAAATDCDADPPARVAYCWELLQSVTPEEWTDAVSMTAEDWCSYYTALVAKLCLVMPPAHGASPGLAGACVGAGPAHMSAAMGACFAAVSSPSGQPAAKQTAAAPGALAGQPATAWPAGDSTATASQAGCSGGSDGDAAGSAASAAAGMRRLVDGFVVRALLGQLVCYSKPARQAACINLMTGTPLSPSADNSSHWRQVAEAMELTEQQMEGMAAALEQVRRYRRRIRDMQLGASASLLADTLTVIQRLEGQAAAPPPQQQQQQARVPGGGVRGSGGAAAAAAARPLPSGEQATDQMHSVLIAWTQLSHMLTVYVFNSLSYRQLAAMLMHAYPLIPQPGILANAVTSLLEERRRGAAAAVAVPCEGAAVPRRELEQQRQREQARSLLVQQQGGDSTAADTVTVSRLLCSQHERQLKERQMHMRQQRASFWRQHAQLLDPEQLSQRQQRLRSNEQLLLQLA